MNKNVTFLSGKEIPIASKWFNFGLDLAIFCWNSLIFHNHK